MKRNMIRVTAVLLSALLGMSLLAPVSWANEGEGEPEVLSYRPVITAQPSVKVKGNTITLSVSARPPEGVEGELSYRWYKSVSMFETPSIGEGESITVDIVRERSGSLLDEDNAVEYLLFMETYYVKVTNHYVDENGEPDYATTTSQGVAVMVRGSYADLVSAYWEEHGAGDANMAQRILMMAISLPIALFQYIKALFLYAGVSVAAGLNLFE